MEEENRTACTADAVYGYCSVRLLLCTAIALYGYCYVRLLLCTAIADLLADKIRKIALNSKLAGTVYDSFSSGVFYSDHKLTSLSTVTPADVYKLISVMIAISSTVDSILTSLIKACPTVFSSHI